MSLFNWFSKKKEADKIIMEEGFCPNCWGQQEYEGKFREAVRDNTKDILNGEPAAQQAFVQKFVSENLTGIRLKRDNDYLVCAGCNTKHHVGDGHNH